MKDVFMHRTALGWTFPKLLVDTKSFEIMQHPAFDAVVSQFWSGASDFSVHMMHGSATFSLLMRTPMNQLEDYEKGIRSMSLTTDRSRTKKFPPHSWSFTGLYEPMKRRFNLELLVMFAWLLYVIWRTLQIYDKVKTMVGAMMAL